MTNVIKACFSTTKRKVISIVCIAIIASMLGTTTVYAVSRSTAIGEETAENYAFADAGVDPASAENVTSEFSFEDGIFVYDIEFYADGSEYEYWIKASDGTVVKKEIEIVSSNQGTTITATITLDDAKKIALADEGISEDDATFTEAKLEFDDGMSVYSIDFYTADTEYEYEINASTGNIYSKSKEVFSTATETTDNSSSITLEKAKALVLEDAGLSESDVTFTKAAKDTDDGVAAYDIEFTTASKEYEYEIRVSDGKIIDKSIEALEQSANSTSSQSVVSTSANNTGSNNGSKTTTTTTTTTTTKATAANNSSSISLEDAKAIALSDAGLSKSDVTFTKAKSDTDDGVAVYDIEFVTSSKEYEYEIKVSNGAIVDKSVETIKTTKTTTTSQAKTSNSTSSISLDKAKSIALSDAGLSKSDVTFTKAKTDTDDGVQVYDIEFTTSSKEYEYEVRVSDGKILDKSVEVKKTTTTSSGSYISVSKAKQIALNKAGLSESQVTFEKAKLEEDDGIMVYEIEFKCSGIEYECTINALSGKILEYESEKD
ncbi:MAG: PepSY domain-containing protein [Ruminococcus sp.]|nr:PepSY domain-containing protein [Ruminococcus sp.]